MPAVKRRPGRPPNGAAKLAELHLMQKKKEKAVPVDVRSFTLEDLDVIEGRSHTRSDTLPTMHKGGGLFIGRGFMLSIGVNPDKVWYRILFSKAERAFVAAFSSEEKEGFKPVHKGRINHQTAATFKHLGIDIAPWMGALKVEKAHLVGLGDVYLLSRT